MEDKTIAVLTFERTTSKRIYTDYFEYALTEKKGLIQTHYDGWSGAQTQRTVSAQAFLTQLGIAAESVERHKSSGTPGGFRFIMGLSDEDRNIVNQMRLQEIIDECLEDDELCADVQRQFDGSEYMDIDDVIWTGLASRFDLYEYDLKEKFVDAYNNAMAYRAVDCGVA